MQLTVRPTRNEFCTASGTPVKFPHYPLYYRPSTFRSRAVEWEETVHQDTGLLGFTTKHLYFSGAKKKFRIRYDKIVDFEPFSDGFEIMRDAQSAKPQAFKTGDGWFAYNLAVNLAQM